MTDITATQVLAHLRDIVSRHGYDTRPKADGGRSCIYASLDGFVLRPVCLIGVMLHDLGVLRAVVYSIYGENAYGYGNVDGQDGACELDAEGMWARLAQAGVTFTDEAKVLMRHAQAEQDSGEVWGDAVEKGLFEAQEKFRSDIEEQVESLREELTAQYTILDAPTLSQAPVEQQPLYPWERDLLNGE